MNNELGASYVRCIRTRETKENKLGFLKRRSPLLELFARFNGIYSCQLWVALLGRAPVQALLGDL